MPPFRHTPAPHPIKRFSALKAPAEVPSAKPPQSRRIAGRWTRPASKTARGSAPTRARQPDRCRSRPACAPARSGRRRTFARCAGCRRGARGGRCRQGNVALPLPFDRGRSGAGAGWRRATGEERRAAKSLLKACERRQWLLSDGADVVLALKAYGRGAMLTPALRKRSAANATNQSTLAALAMASRFSTASGAAPISSFFTGSSIFLPDSVRGIAATA